MDELGWCKTTIFHAGKDGVDIALRFRNCTVVGGESSIGAARKELEAGCTRAVSDTDSACELDEITSSDVVAGQEWRERINRVVDTRVLREVDLGVRETRR